MKKAVLMMMAASCLAVCISGCSGGGTSEPASTAAMEKEGQSTAATEESVSAEKGVPALKGPGNVTLKRMSYNVAWDPNTDIAASVIEESTGYDVEYFTLPAENADQKLILEVAGGVDYDIIQCSPSQFQMLMSQGALEPLNDLLEAYGQDMLNGVSEDSWRACSDGQGNIYGIPYKYPYAQEIDSFMICRWDLMQAAGIEAVPTTIDAFYDCLVKLKEYYGDQYIILSGPLLVVVDYDDLRYIGALSGMDGTCKYMRTEAINHVSVILRSSQNAADAINWINLKQKDQLNINIGVEGTHFTYDADGSINPINPIFSKERGNSYWYNDSTNEQDFAFQWPARVRKSDAQWAAFENVTLYANKNTPEIFVNNDFAFIPGTESYSKYNKALFNSLNDYILQIISGTKSMDDLPTFKSDWSTNGGDAVQTELQEWYTEFYK